MTSKDLKDKKIYVDLHLEISSDEIKERIERNFSENFTFTEEQLIQFIKKYVETNKVYTILSNLEISIK